MTDELMWHSLGEPLGVNTAMQHIRDEWALQLVRGTARVENPPGPYDSQYRDWPTPRPPAGWDVTLSASGMPCPKAWLWVQPALDRDDYEPSDSPGLWTRMVVPVVSWGLGKDRDPEASLKAARRAREMARELEEARDACLRALAEEPARAFLPLAVRFEGVLDEQHLAIPRG